MIMAILNRKYWASIMIAFHQQLAQRGQLVGRILLYLIIVYLFHQVFQSVGAPMERLWYLAVTEWLILSTPPLGFRIAQDIDNGQIVYFMLRPAHYLNLRFFESCGEFSVRFFFLGICCLGLGWVLTSTIPGDIISWCLGILISILAVWLNIMIAILIGVCAFWIRDIKTLIFLNLTATFCFGGLIVPLDFYSPIMRALCFCTPYPWVLWGPAETITRGSLNPAWAFLGWAVWMVILTAAIQWLYRKGINSFVAEGG